MLGREEKEVVMLDLPPPISTNDIWTPVRRKAGFAQMVRSKKYLQWVSDAGFMINAQRPGMVSGKFSFRLQVTRKSRVDLDNVLKATLDLLQNQGIISNDRKCEEIQVKRADVDGMRCTIIAIKGE